MLEEVSPPVREFILKFKEALGPKLPLAKCKSDETLNLRKFFSVKQQITEDAPHSRQEPYNILSFKTSPLQPSLQLAPPIICRSTLQPPPPECQPARLNENQNSNLLAEQIAQKVLEEFNKQTASKSQTQTQTDTLPISQSSPKPVKNFKLDLREISDCNAQKRNLQLDMHTVSVQINPSSSKQTDEDDSFIRYIQYNLIKKNSHNFCRESELPINGSTINFEASQPNIHSVLAKKPSQFSQFEQRQSNFLINKENKLRQQRTLQEQRLYEEEQYIRNYQAEKVRNRSKSSERCSAHERLYQDASRRRDRKFMQEIKLNKQRDVVKKISSDRRIMNNLAKLQIPQDMLNQIFKI